MRSHAACFVLVSTLLLAFPSFAARPFHLTLQRNSTCNEGETTGVLSVNGKEIAKTLELPWRNNERKISRIPAGTYAGTIRQDGDLKWRIELHDVTDRENVQIHIGNYSRNTVGCILVGRSIVSHQNTCATHDSVGALKDVSAAMQAASDDGVSSQPVQISVEVRD